MAHAVLSTAELCPICLNEIILGDTPYVRLACSHALCAACVDTANDKNFASCPVCRNPQLLDRKELFDRKETFRTEYSAWRAGCSRGSTGEVVDISKPTMSKRSSLGLHSASAGDLAILAEPAVEASPDAKIPSPRLKSNDANVGLTTAVISDLECGRPKLGFAIVGMGRAGKIHMRVLGARDDVKVRWMVDVDPTLVHLKSVAPADTQTTADLAVALADPRVDCVIVSTPTPMHAPVIRAALEAGKHVFAEKPLCTNPADVPKLFELAQRHGKLLHTAFNRRHDPAINEAAKTVQSGAMGKVLGATLVSRDYPYPTAAYLQTSGNLFKDCVVHDLDYLTWLLRETPIALRATASTSGDERAGGMYEYSTVHLTFASGANATLINGRVSDSYDHRLDVYCEKGVVPVSNPNLGKPGVAFSDRFDRSYHKQLGAFISGVRGVDEDGDAPERHVNVDAERTMLLETLIDACHESVANDGSTIRLDGERGHGTTEAELRRLSAEINAEITATSSSDSLVSISDGHSPSPTSVGRAPSPALRTYDETTAVHVKNLYRKMRCLQSVEHVQRLRAKYTAPGALGSVRMSVWQAMKHLESFVDVSDPDMTLPNIVHAFQTAEGLRAAGLPDWLQLTGLIHDLGKMIVVRGCDEDGTSVAQQWSIVGDTWIVGCKMPDAMIFPEFNGESPDALAPERTTETGIYEPGCGLDATLCAFGHDEYMYQVLAQNKGVTLPREALFVVRYHSLYPWHDGGCYTALEDDFDRAAKGWVKLFNQHDLYTKREVLYTAEEMADLRKYYTTLIDKYLPAELDW